MKGRQGRKFSILEFSLEPGRDAGFGQDIEAEPAQDGPGGNFHVDAPRSGLKTALNGVSAITSIASASHRKGYAVGGNPTAPAVVGLPFMNDFGIQRRGREDGAVEIDGSSRGRVKSRGEPEDTQPSLAFGLREVSSGVRSDNRMINTGVLQGERKRRNDVHEIERVNDNEDNRGGGEDGPRMREEALFGPYSQHADEKPPQQKTHDSAEDKDQTSDRREAPRAE